VHGGVFSAILDESMGWASIVKSGTFCKTAKLEITFVKETPLLKTYTIESEFVRTIRGFVETSGRVCDDEGTVYVRGSGLYYPMPADFTAGAKEYLTYDDGTLRIFDSNESDGDEK